MQKNYEIILDTLRKIEDRQASMDRDMERDRQELQNITVRLESLEAEVRQTRKAVNLNAERTRDKVAEAVEPLINSSDKMTTVLKKTKKVFVSRSWLDKLLGR
jgi:predicted  nucleic acid-binding Zn-ribbon protein